MVRFVQNFLWGIVLAIGSLLPGVGIQIIFIATGLYDDCISFVFQITEYLKQLGLYTLGKIKKSDLDLTIKSVDWQFGLPIFLALLAIVFISGPVAKTVITNYPIQLGALSFGLVLGTIIVPINEMGTKTWKELLITTVTFFAFGWFFGLPVSTETEVIVPLVNFLGAGVISTFLSFFSSIGAAFSLAFLGTTSAIHAATTTLFSNGITLYTFFILLIFTVACLVSLLIFVRLIHALLENQKSLFLSFVVGLLAASLRLLWPFTNNGNSVAPWQIPLPVFTQQLIFITLSFGVISIIRMLSENKGTLATSFGKKGRTVISTP